MSSIKFTFLPSLEYLIKKCFFNKTMEYTHWFILLILQKTHAKPSAEDVINKYNPTPHLY